MMDIVLIQDGTPPSFQFGAGLTFKPEIIPSKLHEKQPENLIKIKSGIPIILIPGKRNGLNTLKERLREFLKRGLMDFFLTPWIQLIFILN